MVEEEVSQEASISALLSEFNTKLRDIEERQRLVKERVLLIGNNLVELKEKLGEEISDTKVDFEKFKNELENLKESILSTSEEMENFARKSEVGILERQFKMFQPLKFARIEDVRKMIKQQISLKNANTR